MRSAFVLLSDELMTIQRTFGFQSAKQLYELHCPMAFDGRGATWIQNNESVRNPYYGESMLKCADKVEKLEAEKLGEGEAGGGSKAKPHQH